MNEEEIIELVKYGCNPELIAFEFNVPIDEIKKSKIIELRYIKSENDPNIVQQEENKNQFHLHHLIFL